MDLDCNLNILKMHKCCLLLSLYNIIDWIP
uniref:Uncharacterized protein n=1 Tax=Anguilla anguilla TaxID=7936 RepID=A0A0E9VR78_ANGAN